VITYEGIFKVVDGVMQSYNKDTGMRSIRLEVASRSMVLYNVWAEVRNVWNALKSINVHHIQTEGFSFVP
jgi:hypothetical protein